MYSQTDLTKLEATRLVSIADRIYKEETQKEGRYRTSKTFYDKHFQGDKIQPKVQKNLKRLVRRRLMCCYFSEENTRGTATNMSDKVFLEFMKQKEKLQPLLSYLQNMDQAVQKIFTKKERKNPICRDYSWNQQIIAVLDLLELRTITEKVLSDPGYLQQLVKKKNSKKTKEVPSDDFPMDQFEDHNCECSAFQQHYNNENTPMLDKNYQFDAYWSLIFSPSSDQDEMKE